MKLFLRVLPLAVALLVPSAALAEDSAQGNAAAKPAATATHHHPTRTAKRTKSTKHKTVKAKKASKAPKASKKAPKASKKAAK